MNPGKKTTIAQCVCMNEYWDDAIHVCLFLFKVEFLKMIILICKEIIMLMCVFSMSIFFSILFLASWNVFMISFLWCIYFFLAILDLFFRKKIHHKCKTRFFIFDEYENAKNFHEFYYFFWFLPVFLEVFDLYPFLSHILGEIHDFVYRFSGFFWIFSRFFKIIFLGFFEFFTIWFLLESKPINLEFKKEWNFWNFEPIFIEILWIFKIN